MTYRLPLFDHRVLDLAEGFRAYAGRLLGDMGAEVIKVEGPGGDPLRRTDPPLFQRLNVNKYGLELDPDSPHHLDILGRLAALSDILVMPAQHQHTAMLAAAHRGLITLRLPDEATTAAGVAAAGAAGLALWHRRRTASGQEIMVAPHPPMPALMDAPARFVEPVSTLDGVIDVPANPWLLSETPVHIRLPAPALGEHNVYVLHHLLGLHPDG